MKNHDLTKLDAYLRAVHDTRTPMGLALKGRDIAPLVKLLGQPAAAVSTESKTVH